MKPWLLHARRGCFLLGLCGVFYAGQLSQMPAQRKALEEVEKGKQREETARQASARWKRSYDAERQLRILLSRMSPQENEWLHFHSRLGRQNDWVRHDPKVLEAPTLEAPARAAVEEWVTLEGRLLGGMTFEIYSIHYRADLDAAAQNSTAKFRREEAERAYAESPAVARVELLAPCIEALLGLGLLLGLLAEFRLLGAVGKPARVLVLLCSVLAAWTAPAAFFLTLRGFKAVRPLAVLLAPYALAVLYYKRRAGRPLAPDLETRLAAALAPAMLLVLAAEALAAGQGLAGEVSYRALAAGHLALGAALLRAAARLPRRLETIVETPEWRPQPLSLPPRLAAFCAGLWSRFSARICLGYGLWLFFFALALVPAAVIALNAVFLGVDSMAAFCGGDRAAWAIGALTVILALGVAMAGRWRARALAAVGYAPSEDGALMVRLGHRTLWTITLRHHATPADPGRLLAIEGHLAAFAVAALLLASAGRLSWDRRFDALVRERVEAGRPETLSRFQRVVPMEQNGYPPLAAAVMNSKLESVLNAYGRPGLETGRWTEATAAKERGLAAKYEPFLREKAVPLLDRYERFETTDYRLAAEIPSIYDNARLSPTLYLGKLFLERAGLASFDGRMDEAWQAVESLLKLARLVKQPRDLISKMYTVVVLSQANRACLNVMLNRPGASIPGRIASALAALSEGSWVRDGIDASQLRNFDLYRTGTSQWVGGLQDPLATEAVYVSNLDAATLVVHLEDERGLTHPASWRELRGIVAAIQEREERSALRRFFRSVGGGYFTSLSLFRKERELAAWARLALAFSALNEYRAGHGRYPERLDLVAPRLIRQDLLWDPFTDQPFGYAHTATGDGFELWCAGPFKTRTDSRGQNMTLRERF